jgi:adenine/guanine/hypoxanthine permease
MTDLGGRRTTLAAELRGALATFLTMAYILPVNASILSAIYPGKTPALIACTALAAGVCCVLMGLFANAPIALASGMGLNAFVAFTLAKAAGSPAAAMGVVVLEGVIILALVLLGLRESILRAIPRELRLAIGAGIGLFIALIGLASAGISRPGLADGPLLSPGSFRSPATLVASVGLILTAILMAWRLRGALLIGIVATTLLALAMKVATLPKDGFTKPTFSGVLFHVDLRAALDVRLVPLIFAVLMVDFFDTLGTASAIAEQAGLVDKRGQIPGVRRLLIVDSLAASLGGLFGVSSNTCYIESATGVAEGARTGLSTIFVGVLFFAAILLAPLLAVVPPAATAPALILVGFFMLKQVAELNFDKLDEALPAFLTLLTIFATYSIAHGIGLGILTYVAIKLATLRFRDLHPLLILVAGAFVAYFVFEAH